MQGTTSTTALAIRQLRAGAAKERLVKAQARPMRRHESEERLATLRTYHTRRGPELRLVQARPAGHSLTDELPKTITLKVRAPRTILGVEVGGWREVRDIILGTVVMLGLFGGIIILVGIAQAAKS